MDIQEDKDLSLNKTSFGVRKTKTVLLVPSIIRLILSRNYIGTAERWISHLQENFTTFAGALGWTPEEVLKAREEFCLFLEGFIDEKSLKLIERRGYGRYGFGYPSQNDCRVSSSERY